MNSEATGIFQGDLIIQSALREAFRDLRANPWMLPYILNSLAADALTAGEYGQKQIDAARKWILKTEIPVYVNARLETAKPPCVTINLVSSGEGENTLADIHYIPEVPDDNNWPALTPEFTPESWNAVAGTMAVASLPEDSVFPGMKIFDTVGGAHEILEVTYDESTGLTTLSLEPGTRADFRQTVIKSGSPNVITLESAAFNESYLLGAHTPGESWQLTVLHSALVFILLHYRQDLLEARGFEISAISSSDFQKNGLFEGEPVWSRYVTLSGKVRNVWPKRRLGTIQGADTRFTDEDGVPLFP